MSKNDSGGAFPALDDAGTGLHLREHGLSKREYFAAKALQGVMADPNLDITCAEIAQLCVRAADALIAELAK